MKNTRFVLLSAVAVTLAAFLALGSTVPQVSAQSATMAATSSMRSGMGLTKATALTISTENGTPKGIDLTTWDKAFGVAEMTMGTTGSDTIVVLAGGLVPNGLYTLWWVDAEPTMTMGPLTNGSNNSFKADANGYGTISFSVPSDNKYQLLFVVYHADGQTHGDMPGTMGSQSFSQLSGEFPGPGGMAPMMSSSNNMSATMAPTAAK
ncbi:MAG: hypothetical protein ACYDBJ_20945 [Aggregatilineales bacterium]